MTRLRAAYSMRYSTQALSWFAATVAVLSGSATSTSADGQVVDGGTSDNAEVVPAARPPAGREKFVVEPFQNANDVGSLNYLRTGLPAFIAERLGRVQPLQFVGPSTLLGGPASPVGAWLVGGRFSKSREQVTVTVSVRRSGQDSGAVEVSRTGSKEHMPQLALVAAVEAFQAATGAVQMSLQVPVMAFARDPYAFVLYARGVGAHVGLASPDNSQATAKKWLSRALRIDPRCAEIMRYLGVVELAEGSGEHARADWLGALDIRSDYLAALKDLARLDLDGKRPSARERYARVVALDPEDADARRTYGQLLVEAGDFARAKGELERVLARSPDDLAARRALVPVLGVEGSSEALVDDLEAIVRLDDNNQGARLDLAAAYSSVGRLLDAESTYDEVLRRKPRQPTLLKSAGDLAFSRGDYGKALSYFQRMRAAAPSDPRPVFRLATVYFAAGDLKAAERWFYEGAQFPGMTGPAYANLGAISLRRGQTKEALWLLGRAVKRRPRQVSVRYNLALAMLRDQRPTEAMTELYTARDIAPDDAGVHFLIGVVALQLERPSEAEQAFRETLRVDPRHADAAHNLDLLKSLHKPEPEALLRFQ